VDSGHSNNITAERTLGWSYSNSACFQQYVDSIFYLRGPGGGQILQHLAIRAKKWIQHTVESMPTSKMIIPTPLEALSKNRPKASRRIVDRKRFEKSWCCTIASIYCKVPKGVLQFLEAWVPKASIYCKVPKGVYLL
jgi:hypothetical protein